MRTLVFLASGLAVGVLLVGTTRASEAMELRRVPLTRSGDVLWNFENLLRSNFPNQKAVSATVVDHSGALDFVCGGFCAPNSRYSSYIYIFASRNVSAYHLARRTFSGSWGNYRRQVLIRGRSVACNSKETTFLVQQRQAVSFKLECAMPPA